MEEDEEDLFEVEDADEVEGRSQPWKLEVELGPAPEPAALEREWRALVDRSDASFFLSWPWIGTWLERSPAAVWLARIARSGETIALALLGERRRGLGPLAVRTLHLHATGEPHADRIAIEHNDLLAARGFEFSARLALLDRLLGRSRRRRPRAVVLPMVGEAMEAAAVAAGLRSRRRAETRCAVVDLEAIRLWGHGYLGVLSPGTRAQIRRAARLYGERGALRVEPAVDVAQAIAWLEPLGELHEARFKAKGSAGAFAVPGFVEFHRSLLTRAWPEGTVEILRVGAGAETIGYLYNFLWRGWVGYYTSGFVYTDDNRLKPGLVAHWLAIERHLAGGARTYDLMAGESRYKGSLAEPGPILVDLVCEPDDLLARLGERVRRLRDRLRAAASAKGGAGQDAAAARLAASRPSC